MHAARGQESREPLLGVPRLHLRFGVGERERTKTVLLGSELKVLDEAEDAELTRLEIDPSVDIFTEPPRSAGHREGLRRLRGTRTVAISTKPTPSTTCAPACRLHQAVRLHRASYTTPSRTTTTCATTPDYQPRSIQGWKEPQYPLRVNQYILCQLSLQKTKLPVQVYLPFVCHLCNVLAIL